MDSETLDRIETTHGPNITWPDGQVTYVCLCGGGWPCNTWQRANDARQQQARIARDARQATPWQ